MSLLSVATFMLLLIMALRIYTWWPNLLMPVDVTEQCPTIYSYDSYDVLHSKEQQCMDYYSSH